MTVILLITSACVRVPPQIVVITATPVINEVVSQPPTNLPTLASTPLPNISISEVTPLPTNLVIPLEYVVQPGDTLSGIANVNRVSLETLLQLNNISDPNILTVGQVIKLPPLPDESGESFRIVPDSRLVRGPGSKQFSVEDFVSRQPGYIRIATDIVENVILSASEVIDRVSVEFSVDPRILLSLLEYQNKWLTQADLDEDAKIYAIQDQASEDGFDRRGLYRQLAWTANQLNRGYYERKYTGALSQELRDGTRLTYNTSLNAGTIGIQYLLGLLYDYSNWTASVGANGLYQTYVSYFGDPFVDAIEPVVPADLQQPEFTFPFPQGETWFFTGGPHGGWGSGSAWSAVDFAPPDDRPDGSPLCYVSEFSATAVANGIIARSKDGMVLIDLDGDGDETTGWVILYLHIAAENRVQEGSLVNTGDFIGHPSCEGGFSNATHMHIGRRYNGEWLPASCEDCLNQFPSFVMSGWTIFGLPNQEYQGYMLRGNEERSADQGRLSPTNRVEW